jgi:DnaK suppressor protein
VSKPSAKKKTGKPRTGKKAAVARKKPPTRPKVARKGASGRVVRKKTVKKTARKAARKPAEPRTLAKNEKVATKVARNTAPTPLTVAVPLEPLVKRTTYLKKKDLELFRELLLTKRAELVGDVSTLQKQALSENRQEAAGDLSSMPIHMADLGTDNYEKEFTLGLIESQRTLLREIDEALGRIDDGTYGVCEATGRPIGKTRLKAQPWVRFCYEYMLAQEEGRRSSGL